MDDRDYNFINQHGYDESNFMRKKYHRIIVMVLSVCVIIELASIGVLIHYSDRIKEYADRNSDTENEETSEVFSFESRDAGSIIKQAVKDRSFNLSDNKEMYVQLKEIVQESEKYIATVCTCADTESWQEGKYNVTSGMVVSKSSEIIIITDLASTITSGFAYVIFFGGKSYKGTVMDIDETLGIAAIKVNRVDMDEAVYEDIETAQFAGKGGVSSGESVIVMGNPYGKDSYAAYGNITSVSNNINIIDGSCHLLTTDINKSENMNGFVINLEGQVVGIVNNTLKQKSMEGIVSALVIWDAEDSIEYLTEGIKKVYLGVEGEDITEEVIKIVDEDMPFGVYVKDVVQDSPAYDTGILSGDIIVNINGTDVKTMHDIMTVLAKCEIGQEITVDVMRRGRNQYKSIGYKIILASTLFSHR